MVVASANPGSFETGRHMTKFERYKSCRSGNVYIFLEMYIFFVSDYEMSKARQELNWNRMFELAIDPEKARRYRAESMPEHEDSCTMCGKMCSMRNMNKILEGKDINLLREDA